MKKFYLMMLAVVMAFTSQAQLLSESFEGAAFPPAGWTLVTPSGEYEWETYTSDLLTLYDLGAAQNGNVCAGYFYSETTAANSWLITKGVTLEAGKAYNLTFYYRASAAGPTVYPEKMKVTVGTTNTVAGQSTTLWDNAGGTQIATSNWTLGSASFTPNVAGTYYFGFHVYSDPDKYLLLLDNIKLDEAPSTAPSCATLVSPANNAVDVEPFPITTLTWTEAAGALEYDLYLSETGDANDYVYYETYSTTTAEIEELPYSSTFYWYVVPKNNVGEATGCAANAFKFTTKDAPPLPFCTTPVEPALDGTVAIGPDDDYSVTLSWNASENAQYYFVFLSNGEDPLEISEETLLGVTTATSATISGFPYSTEFQWMVLPYNGSGFPEEECEANVWTFTTSGPANPIPECTTIISPLADATDVDPKGVEFAWEAAPNATDYIFIMYEDAEGNNPIQDVSGYTDGETSFTISGFEYGTTYYWQVIPVNADDEGYNNCPILAFTTSPYPAAPANDNCSGAIALTHGNEIEGTTIGATQSLPANECAGYIGSANDDVWYSFTGTGQGAAVITAIPEESLDFKIELFTGTCGNLTQIGCSDDGLEGEEESITLPTTAAGTIYYIRVYGYYDGTGSTGNFTIQATGDGVLPVTYSKFTGERKQSVNVLRWETASETNNKGFELQRSIDGTNFSTLAFVPSQSATGNSSGLSQYSYTDTKPFNSSNYYRLRQIDQDGRSNYSQVVRLLGITNNLELVALYPNPAKQLLNLMLASPKADKVTLTVSDITGKVVLRQTRAVANGDNQLQLDVHSLSAGTYMVKATCANGCETAVKKFVKQ